MNARRFGVPILTVVALALAGCRYYYAKPGGTYLAFAVDHAMCMKQVGLTSPDGELNAPEDQQ